MNQTLKNLHLYEPNPQEPHQDIRMCLVSLFECQRTLTPSGHERVYQLHKVAVTVFHT